MDPTKITVTQVIHAVTVHSNKGEHMEMTNRPTYGLSFCIDGGRITYIHNGKHYIEDKDHAVILPQGQSYRLQKDISGTFPVINFTSAEPLCDTVTVIEVSGTDHLWKLYEEIRRLLAAGENRAKILSLFYEMIAELTSPKRSNILTPALRLLYERYADPTLQNADLAAACSISEVYLRKLFKTELGRSPKQYILSLRLQKAGQLLAEGCQSTSAIALACGFESSAHFCRVFKKHFGITTGEYRLRHRNDRI